MACVSLKRTGIPTFTPMKDVPSQDRLGLIETIHNSLPDPTWEADTDFVRRKYLDSPLKNYEIFELARIAEKVIGYVLVRPQKTDPNASYLSYIVVHQEEQNKGYGSLLLDKAIETIKELGKQFLTVDCDDQAKGFYEKYAEKHNIALSTQIIGCFRSGKTKYMVTFDLGIHSSSSKCDKAAAACDLAQLASHFSEHCSV